jgi:hypothetical protein
MDRNLIRPEAGMRASAADQCILLRNIRAEFGILSGYDFFPLPILDTLQKVKFFAGERRYSH